MAIFSPFAYPTAPLPRRWFESAKILPHASLSVPAAPTERMTFESIALTTCGCVFASSHQPGALVVPSHVVAFGSKAHATRPGFTPKGLPTGAFTASVGLNGGCAAAAPGRVAPGAAGTAARAPAVCARRNPAAAPNPPITEVFKNCRRPFLEPRRACPPLTFPSAFESFFIT